jgi:phospholipase/carboxylesterase
MSDFDRALGAVGSATLRVATGFEAVGRRLHPGAIADFRAAFGSLADELGTAIRDLRALELSGADAALAAQLLEAADHSARAASDFARPASEPEAIPQILGSMRRNCRALEAIYPLRRVFPAVGRFFVEEQFHDQLDRLDPEPAEGVKVGLYSTKGPASANGRGGFSLYVPEQYRGDQSVPLVVALHGGYGNGRDFLWTWLREARGHGFLLLAPTSVGTTWSFMGPDADAVALAAMVEYVARHWRVDRERILLTGLSDGATYTLFAGLREGAPWSALAPISGVLHPEISNSGNLAHARGRRIYLVHGTLDWMFPVALAHMARDALLAAGAELVFREIEDLPHAYPREENARILDWFDPRKD